MSWLKIGALILQLVNWFTRRADINQAKELERLRLEKEGRDHVEDMRNRIDAADRGSVSDDEVIRRDP